MNIPTTIQRQQGVALILSLIMLLVLTVLGVSSFQNSHIQERSAGNARLQAVAFEAAAAGAVNSIGYFDENRDDGEDELCGEFDHGGWENADGEPVATDWVEMGSVGEANLKQRMYCLANDYSDDGSGRPSRSQLFVLSRGEVRIGEGENEIVVAQRDIEVRIGTMPVKGIGDGCGAICFPGCEAGELYFPNSEDFWVDGNGGPAITGGNAECPVPDGMVDAIEEAIRDDRIGNYYGGIALSNAASPWDTAENVEAFRENVEAQALAAQEGGACQTFCYSSGYTFVEGEHLFGEPGSPQVTYIDGDAEIGGQVAGTGILMVTGTLSWHGQPNWRGLIVTLGGHFHVEGHGEQGGDSGGSLVILNAPGDGSLGPAGFYNEGGGEGHYLYGCGNLQIAHDALNPDGQGMWDLDCEDIPGTPYTAGLSDLRVISWRENVGWREEFFGSD